MPVMCIYRAPGVTPDDYDNVRNYLRWEDNPPHGGLAHFLSFKDGEAVEIDIWESVEDFHDFYVGRFRPALKRFGIQIDDPEVLELHAVAMAEAMEAHVLPSSRTRRIPSLKLGVDSAPPPRPSSRPHRTRHH